MAFLSSRSRRRSGTHVGCSGVTAAMVHGGGEAAFPVQGNAAITATRITPQNVGCLNMGCLEFLMDTLRHAVEEVDEPGGERVLGAHHEQAVAGDQGFEDL